MLCLFQLQVCFNVLENVCHTQQMSHKVSKKHLTQREVNRGSLYCEAEVEV